MLSEIELIQSIGREIWSIGNENPDQRQSPRS